jgi:hypothetical protein
VFEHYLKRKVGNRLIKSPFREDNKPTCGFYYSKTGRLYLHDFGTAEHFDCFEIVKRKYKLSYREAMDRIISDKDKFEIGSKIEKDQIKLVEFVLGDPKSLKYFHQYYITNPTLESYRVFPARTVYINQKPVYRSTKGNPTFVYLFSSGRVKTYKPLTVDSKTKWGGNSGGEDVFGLDRLPKTGQLLFVTSSLKDIMVLKELGYNAIAFNGEGYGLGEGETSRFVTKTLAKLERRFEHIVFYLDNDEPGINFATKLAHKFSKKFIYNPIGTPKDISDYVKAKSFYNGKRRIKRLLSKTFRVQSGFLDFVQNLDYYGNGNHDLSGNHDSLEVCGGSENKRIGTKN